METDLIEELVLLRYYYDVDIVFPHVDSKYRNFSNPVTFV